MLLRSITGHVKDQNWIAIGIDFFIVVVGVFIGLQVSNWNDEKIERHRADEYSVRLVEELRTEYEYSMSLLQYYTQTREAGIIAYNGLSGRSEYPPETILINAFRASQYNWYERRRSVFDEIVSTGSLHLVSNLALRSTSVSFYNTPLFSILQDEGQYSAYRELFREIIEPHVHDELLLNCGDKEYEGKMGTRFLVTLGYSCKINLSEQDISSSIEVLRSESKVVKALRLRNAQIAGRINDLQTTLESSGILNLVEPIQ
jgi:hypothetical protein